MLSRIHCEIKSEFFINVFCLIDYFCTSALKFFKYNIYSIVLKIECNSEQTKTFYWINKFFFFLLKLNKIVSRFSVFGIAICANVITINMYNAIQQKRKNKNINKMYEKYIFFPLQRFFCSKRAIWFFTHNIQLMLRCNSVNQFICDVHFPGIFYEIRSVFEIWGSSWSI